MPKIEQNLEKKQRPKSRKLENRQVEFSWVEFLSFGKKDPDYMQYLGYKLPLSIKRPKLWFLLCFLLSSSISSNLYLVSLGQQPFFWPIFGKPRFWFCRNLAGFSLSFEVFPWIMANFIVNLTIICLKSFSFLEKWSNFVVFSIKNSLMRDVCYWNSIF